MGAASERWLEIHGRALDTVRAVIDGLDNQALNYSPPGTNVTIAGEARHVIEAECYWMQEVGFHPELPKAPKEVANPGQLTGALDAIEKEHGRLISERPGDKDVLFGLGRVSQHALYHVARMSYLRMCQQPDWDLPKPETRGSWESAVDLITDTLISA